MVAVIVGGYRQVTEKHQVSVNSKHGVRREESISQVNVNHIVPLLNGTAVVRLTFAIVMVKRFPE